MAIKQETGKEHVENLLNYGLNFSIYHSSANPQLWSYLENLYDFLLDQEQEFYNALGVSTIQGLNSLLNKIGNTYNLKALDAGGAVFQKIKERFVFKDKSKSEEQKNQKAEQDIFALITKLVSDMDANLFVNPYLEDGWNSIGESRFNGLMDALAAAFDNVVFNNGLIKYEFSSYNRRYGATKLHSKETLGNVQIKVLDLTKAFSKKADQRIEIKQDHFVVSGDASALTPKLKEEIKSIIRPALEEYLNIEYTGKRLLENMSFDSIREEVIKIIRESNIELKADDIAACANIAIGAGSGNISGFLGELQSRLYFKALFPDISKAEIIDAGASYIKSMSGATQMDPADTQIKVLNHLFNIQVKNYASGGADWSGSSKKLVQTLGGTKKIDEATTAEGFVKERLQISDPMLLNFFGAATWHNLNLNYSNDKGYTEYSTLYQDFQKIFESLKGSFDTFLPNIIRLTAIIDGLDGLQYENFYFQKGVMIPASAVVDSIMEVISNPQSTVFTSSYEMYPGASHFTYQHPFEDNYSAYAKETLINWHVTVNFNQILSKLK